MAIKAEKAKKAREKRGRKAAKKQLKKDNKFVYLDDNTWNHLNFSELNKIFPNAYLIHIFRDPRDVVLSLSKQRWSPNTLKDCIIFYRQICFESRWEKR